MDNPEPPAAPPVGDAPPPPPSAPVRDVLLLCGDGGAGAYGVIRQRQERIEVGRIRPVRDGQPISGELVRLAQRKEHERLFDVEVLYDAKREATQGNGPAARDGEAGETPPDANQEQAQRNGLVGWRNGPPIVSTHAYRAQWERIFGAGTADSAGALPTGGRGSKGNNDLS